MNRLLKTASVIRCWRKNIHSKATDHVRGVINLKENTYLLFRCKRGVNSRLVTRVVHTEYVMPCRYRGHRYTSRNYGRTKLEYVQKHYPNLVTDLEKRLSWELLKV
jgi:hypothetical protein